MEFIYIKKNLILTSFKPIGQEDKTITNSLAHEFNWRNFKFVKTGKVHIRSMVQKR